MVTAMLLVVKEIFPLTAKLKVPMARILPASSKPAFVKLAITAFTSMVMVMLPLPEAASIMTGFDDVGTSHPGAPPLVSAHRFTSLQLPVPPTQNRLVPQPTAVSSIAIASPAAHPPATERVTVVLTEVWVSTIMAFLSRS
jgi:hypothetical protein